MICTMCHRQFKLGQMIYTSPVVYSLDVEDAGECIAEALCEDCFFEKNCRCGGCQ